MKHAQILLSGAAPRALVGRVLANADDPRTMLSQLTAAFGSFKDRQDTRLAAIEQSVEQLSASAAAHKLGGNGGPLGDPASSRVHSALGRFAKTGQVSDLAAMSVNAAMSTQSDPDGGYLAPEELDRSIVQLQRNLSPMRRLATNVQTSSGTYQLPVSQGGTASGWVAEEDSRPNTAGPKLSLLTYVAGEIYANIPVTQTLLDDAAVDVGKFVMDEASKEFTDREGDAFLNGDGIKKPRGLLTYATSSAADAARPFGTLQYVATTAAATLASSNPTDQLNDLIYSLKAGYRQNARWLMNSKTASVLSKLKDSTGQALWQPAIAAGQPPLLMGYPIEADEGMPDIGANTFPIAFGDFKSGYLVLDRLGTRILRDPYSNKPFVQFYMTKRVGGGLRDSNAIKLLKVATS